MKAEVREAGLEATAYSPVKPRIGSAKLRIALIVPSYRRPADLRRCLRAITLQQRPPDQLIVVVREDDAETRELAGERGAWIPAPTVVCVHTSGVVAALNAGVAAADADVIAFTDDDAAPRPDWLTRIERHYHADPDLGGLGGRDWITQHGRLEDESRAVVGELSWFGRSIGQHHLGIGPPRQVDTLKGVNMSFRVRALGSERFDPRLRGSGAQVANELGVCLAVKRRGWKLVYDPSVAVDHYPSVRHDEDQRNRFSGEAVFNAAFNEALLLCEHLPPWRRVAFMAWALMLGHRAAPGLLQWPRLLVVEPRTATRRLRMSCAGRVAGFRAAR